MKKAFLYIVCVSFFGALIASCNNNPDVVTLQSSLKDQAHQLDTANYTAVKWLDSLKDFGTVIKGDTVKIVFNFLNTGTKPLYLSEVRPGCGCTLADYTKSAVLPGQQGQVVALYDSNHGSPNQQVHKTVTVTCNAKNATRTILAFSGLVKAKS